MEQVGQGHLEFAGSAALAPTGGRHQTVAGRRERIGNLKYVRRGDVGILQARQIAWKEVSNVAGESSQGLEERRERLARRRRLAVQFQRVYIHVMIDVGAVVAGRISARRADVTRIRVTEDLDHAVLVVAFLLIHVAGEIIHGVLQGAQGLRELIGVIEHGNGVVHCGDGAVINLFEMGLAGGDLRRIDVEGVGVGIEPLVSGR